MTGHHIKVTAYSGYKGNERPLSFIIDDQRHEVRDMISGWAEPDKDFFNVIADDNKVYTLSWNRKSDLWLIEKISERENMDDWCDQQDIVPNGNRIYRCSKCGKRLQPRRIFGSDGEIEGWSLPPHKKKGHKIKAVKKRQHKMRTA